MDIRNFGFLLHDVSRLYQRHFELHAGEIGVTLPQAKVLGILSRTEGTTQARLAEVSQTDPTTLVRLLDRMEQDGWIERRADATDRRVRRLYLRTAAKPVLDSIAELAKQARGIALSGLKAGDSERFMQLLDAAHRNLTAEEEDAPTDDAAAARSAPRPRASATTRRKLR